MSIQGQRELLLTYIAGRECFRGWETAEFCDDGYSGTSFDRPGMRDLLEQARHGKIGCVVVKDLSRFGREYVEAGFWIEQMFPRLGVRLISVNEGYDSGETSCGEGLSAALQNLVHTLYSRDLSRKISSARRVRMQQGAYTSSAAPFGYQKSVDERGKLEPDADAAKVVRDIFIRAANGERASGIAQALNRNMVPTPRSFQKQRLGQPIPGNFWTGDAVRRILRDERYMGMMVSGKRRRNRMQATEKIGRAEWVRVADTHPALVSQQTFEQAQRALKPLTEKQSACRNAPGKVKCGVCGFTMRRRNQSYYYCDTSRQTNSPGCAETRIDCVQLESALQETAALLARLAYCKAAGDILALYQSQAREKEKRQREIKLQQEKQLQAQRCLLYEKWKENKITQEQYIAAREKRSAPDVDRFLFTPVFSLQWNDWVTFFDHGTFSNALKDIIVQNWIKEVYFYDKDQVKMLLKCHNTANI